jgi:hypothetical protein
VTREEEEREWGGSMSIFLPILAKGRGGMSIMLLKDNFEKNYN